MLNISILAASVSENTYLLLLPIALIIALAKFLSIVCEKIGMPKVVGYLLAGVLLGLITFIPGQGVFTYGADGTMSGISDFGKIGVILIMFSAGLEIDMKQVKATGVASIIITSLGVIVPVILGFLVAWLFYPDNSVYTNLFYGVILSATSVSITVAVLKELGKLNTRVGSCIVSAAILDDIIGIILLSVILSLGTASVGDAGLPFGLNTGIGWLNTLLIIVFIVAFFVFAFIIYFPARKFFVWLNKKWPHHLRTPIFSFAFCFLMAYVAEEVFGVADITGAFVAGMILSMTNNNTKEYVDSHVESSVNMMFGSIFFASVGLMIYDPSRMASLDGRYIGFGVLLIVAGLLGKVIGAGIIGGAITKFNFKDSIKIGVGMMARAEVIVVTAQMGVDGGIIPSKIMPFIVVLIIVSSFLTPILLKLLYKDELGDGKNGATADSVKKTQTNI